MPLNVDPATLTHAEREDLIRSAESILRKIDKKIVEIIQFGTDAAYAGSQEDGWFADRMLKQQRESRANTEETLRLLRELNSRGTTYAKPAP